MKLDRRVVPILAIAALASCTSSTERPAAPGIRGVPDSPPSITGIITAIDPGRAVRIEVNPHETSGSDKALVRLAEGASILDRSGAVRRFEELRPGQTASAWFTGPVAESYPVQATANVIVLESAAIDSTITARGFGPVVVGMTLAEAEAALHAELALVPPGEPCSYAFVGTDRVVALMVIDGRIARVDVQHGTVKTAEGAGIGDSEERIRALYPGRVEVLPHKYIDGHYLTVTPAAPADSAYRIVFETDGRHVLRYRAGRLPEVRWIEGCS